MLVAKPDDLLDGTYKEITEAFPELSFRKVPVDLGRQGYVEEVATAIQDIDVQVCFLNAGYIQTGLFHKTALPKLYANLECNVGHVVGLTHLLVNRCASGPRDMSSPNCRKNHTCRKQMPEWNRAYTLPLFGTAVHTVHSQQQCMWRGKRYPIGSCTTKPCFSPDMCSRHMLCPHIRCGVCNAVKEICVASKRRFGDTIYRDRIQLTSCVERMKLSPRQLAPTGGDCCRPSRDSRLDAGSQV